MDRTKKARNKAYSKVRKFPGCGGVGISWDENGNAIVLVNALEGFNNTKMIDTLPNQIEGVPIVIRKVRMGILQ